MKKRKFKNYLKLGCFLFGISLLLWNCERESITEDLQTIEQGNSFIKRAKLTTLKDLSSFVHRLQDGNNSLSKNSLEDVNNFTILEDRDVFIYTDSTSTTYTLAIRKDNQAPFSFSNLIVKFENDSPTKASILNYVPTQQYLTAYNLDERSPFEGTIAYEAIDYDGSLDHLNTKTSEDCTSYSITFCNLDGETHIADKTCHPDYMWTIQYTICEEPEEIVPPPPYDYSDTSGDVDSPSGGGVDNGDGTTAPVPPCESAGGDTGIAGADSDCIMVHPCESIQGQVADAEFSNIIEELKEKTGQTKERGYSQEKDTTQTTQTKYTPLQNVPSGHAIKISINRFTTIGFIHNHLDAILTDRYDPDDKQIEQEAIRMFSPKDVEQFLAIAKNTKYNNIPLSDIYVTMVSSKGTYTLKFTGNRDDIPANLDTSLLKKEYKTEMKKYNKKSEGLLHFLKKHIGINGIKLYRIKPDGTVVERRLDENEEMEDVPCV